VNLGIEDRCDMRCTPEKKNTNFRRTGNYFQVRRLQQKICTDNAYDLFGHALILELGFRMRALFSRFFIFICSYVRNLKKGIKCLNYFGGSVENLPL